MKKFIETLKNIWKIKDLRQRILLTLGLILIYRVGSFIILPGVDHAALAAKVTDDGGEGLIGLLTLFTGGAFSRASIFALGIMPYISASIIMQLLGVAVPTIQKMRKEGEAGQRKINNWTRILTIAITGVQAPSYIATYVSQDVRTPEFAMWACLLILVAGTMFVMWLGEKITDKGIGNGISLIIMIGIIAGLPQAFIQEAASRTTGGGGGYVILLVEIAALLIVILLSVAVVQAVRRVPVQFAKRAAGTRELGQVRKYIPLKVNAAGVMPIIFAQAIMFVPLYVAQAYDESKVPEFLTNISDFTSWEYNLIFFFMIVIFTYFYTAITVNPNQMADDMKRNGGFIPGIKPGRKTAEYLDVLLSRITLPGSVFLACIAILPAFASMAGIQQGMAQFYGGTSLLIMVGVVLDTLQQVESHLLSRHYDGLMKSGRIKGRMSSQAMQGYGTQSSI